MPMNLLSPSVIHIEGDASLRFLQGQLSCDVQKAQTNHLMKGAMCNNKGRVIASFWLWRDELSYFMLLPDEMLAIVILHLQKYAKFSKVNISECEEMPIKIPTMLETIREGFALIFPNHSNKFTPHELSYHKIGVISFDKGCYIGQEIIARVHYRGKSKQHLYHVELNEEQLLLPLEIINIIKREDGVYEALLVAQDLSPFNIKVVKSYE
jgi:hypothetical protein